VSTNLSASFEANSFFTSAALEDRSRPELGEIRPQVERQRHAYQTEADARGNDRNQHG
jgi:hypothetical protein